MVTGVDLVLPRRHERDDDVARVRTMPEVHDRIGQQKRTLGERLYQRISPYQPELAGKITGMLLEWSYDELRALLDSERQLLEAIDQVMHVIGETRMSGSRRCIHGSSDYVGQSGAEVTFDCDGVAPVRAYAATSGQDGSSNGGTPVRARMLNAEPRSSPSFGLPSIAGETSYQVPAPAVPQSAGSTPAVAGAAGQVQGSL